MSPASIPRSVDTLNRLRREAVALRLGGATLARTREAVGLSAPTILAAVRAWEGGGWDAVDVGRRGRPRLDDTRSMSDASSASRPVTGPATGPSVDPDIDSAIERGSRSPSLDERLRSAATLDGDAPVDAGPWDIERVMAWLAAEGTPASRSTVVTRLAEWRLAPPSRHRRLLASTDERYRTFARSVRRRGIVLLWIGDRRLADGRTQLFAHDPRGRARWTLAAAAPSSSDWVRFLDALHAPSGRVALVLPGAHFARDPAIRTWLDSREAEYRVVVDPIDSVADGRDHVRSPARAKERTVTPAPAATASTTATDAASSADIGAPSQAPLTHLERLEAESIQIMREVVAEADNPVMLYSIGKDSAVMLHLARKAFFPAPPPFPLLHVDTTWKFRAMYEFRDRIADEYGLELLVHVNPEGLAQGVNPFTHGSALHTDIMKTQGLKQALDEHRFDVAFGGARRDEEKSRAKERVFSFRSARHRWEPKSQRPELWSLYNARKRPGESIRVFPISNWTELDVWQYIHREGIPIVPLYLAAERPVVTRDGTLIMVDDERMPLLDGEVPEMRRVRFRTLGCYPLTGAVESDADSLSDVIREMLLTRTSERQGRMIDHDSAASMEKKKQEGYF